MNRLVKVLAAALVASVLLNAFFIGFWAARAIRPGGHGPFRDRGAFPRPMARDDHDRPPGFGEVWRKHVPELEGPRRAVEEARSDVRNALTAEPYHEAALEAALARLRTVGDEAQAAFHRSLVSMAREMKPEERRALAESHWFTGFERRGGRGGRGGGAGALWR